MKNTSIQVHGQEISHWLSTKFTVAFMGLWEQMHNPVFNVTEFSSIKNEAGSNGFVLSSKQWIEKTNAIGITSKAGRYSGGTFAHKDIAFEFAARDLSFFQAQSDRNYTNAISAQLRID
jgi:hypothetical protein